MRGAAGGGEALRVKKGWRAGTYRAGAVQQPRNHPVPELDRERAAQGNEPRLVRLQRRTDHTELRAGTILPHGSHANWGRGRLPVGLAGLATRHDPKRFPGRFAGARVVMQQREHQRPTYTSG